MSKSPKVLIYDIETSPIIANVWGLFDQNIGLNQIKQDWHLLAFSAKWLGDNRIIYSDQRKVKDITNDKNLVLTLRNIIDAADIVVTQNGKKFDAKKLNARLAFHGLNPPRPHKHIDTCQLARKNFGFTSNKLEYLSRALGTKHKKLVERKFAGFDLWKECISGNIKAWKEMEKYNKADVLATEELYKKLAPWGSGLNMNVFRESKEVTCSCGSMHFQKRGFAFTNTGKFQIFQCQQCGTYTRSGKNEFSKEQKKAFRREL